MLILITFFYYQRHKTLCPVVTLSAKDNQKLSKFFTKGFERSVYWNEFKTKSENKNTTSKYIFFLESKFVGVNRLFVIIYSNQDDNIKRYKAKSYYLLRGVIKNYNAIIGGKNFYDQPFDSDIKRFQEIRKLTTEQGESYTNGCLLDYDYIKNHYRLIVVDLSRKKRTRYWSESNSANRIC